MFNFWNSRRTKYLIDIAYCPSNFELRTSNLKSQTSNLKQSFHTSRNNNLKRFQSLRLK